MILVAPMLTVLSIVKLVTWYCIELGDIHIYQYNNEKKYFRHTAIVIYVTAHYRRSNTFAVKAYLLTDFLLCFR